MADGAVGVGGGTGSESLLARVQPYDRLRSYLTGVTPEYATALVRGASNSGRGQARLFETILARDPMAGTAFDKRVGNLLSATWTFQAVDEAAERAAAPLLATLPPKGLQKAVEWLGQAPLYGYAVVEIVWAADGTVERLAPIPYDALDTMQGQLLLYLDGRAEAITEMIGGSGSMYGQPDPEVRRRLVVVTADDHDPASAAKLRRIVGPWLISSFLLRDWSRYLERFGNPIVKGKYPRNAAPDESGKSAQASLLEALEALHACSRIALPEDLEAELLSDARADASNAFDRLLDRCERRIVRTILGQDSTTMGGSSSDSRASSEVRERVEDTIAERDAGLVCEALNEQLVQPLEAVKAKGRHLIELAYNWRREQDPVQRSTVLVNVAAAGGQFDWAPVLEELGLKPAPGAPVDGAARQAAARETRLGRVLDLMCSRAEHARECDDLVMAEYWTREAMKLAEELDERRRAFGRQGPGKAGDAIDSLTDDGAEELTRHLRRALPAAIRAAVPADATPAEAERALSRLLTEEHVAPIAEILERGILAARYNGTSNAQAWIERSRKRRS